MYINLVRMICAGLIGLLIAFPANAQIITSKSDIDTRHDFIITFSKPINGTSATTRGIYFKDTDGNKLVPQEIDYDPKNPDKLTVKAPENRFEVDSNYTLVITGIKSQDGKALENSTMMFSTITPIFKGAEGCGALAGTNLNTTTYHVINLNDSGVGSFRDAVSRPNRTVVFDVAGTINLKSELAFSSNLIIDGQTAPRGGITISGSSSSIRGVQNDVIRYVRFREGSASNPRKCCLYIDDAKDIMVDHVSIEFGRWDNLHLENSSNVTIQYSIIADGIAPQYFGSIMQQCDNISIHHCLYANNRSRNPKGKSNFQFANNVVYNWSVCGFVGGHSTANHYQDLINNYFICGHNSNDNFIGECTSTDHIYNSNNYFDGNKDGVLNGRLITDNDISSRNAAVRNTLYIKPIVPITLQTAAQAYNTVINEAGDSLYRDTEDSSVINGVKSLGK